MAKMALEASLGKRDNFGKLPVSRKRKFGEIIGRECRDLPAAASTNSGGVCHKVPRDRHYCDFFVLRAFTP